MKNLILLTLLIVTAQVSAQSYTVIHIIGKIYDTESGRYLKKRMKIKESAKLRFESPSAKAAVLSSSRGRFVIQKQQAASSSGALTYALSSVLSPARGRLSTRAAGINNKMDFVKKFGEGPIAWLNENYEISVSPKAFPMDGTMFFYVSYLYQGETINKKLSYQGENLIFDKAGFYAVDNQTIDPNRVSDMNLYYFNSTKEESELITSLQFVIVSNDDLKSIVESLEGIAPSEKTQVVAEFVNSLFGKCTNAAIEKALSAL